MGRRQNAIQPRVRVDECYPTSQNGEPTSTAVTEMDSLGPIIVGVGPARRQLYQSAREKVHLLTLHLLLV